MDVHHREVCRVVLRNLKLLKRNRSQTGHWRVSSLQHRTRVYEKFLFCVTLQGGVCLSLRLFSGFLGESIWDAGPKLGWLFFSCCCGCLLCRPAVWPFHYLLSDFQSLMVCRLISVARMLRFWLREPFYGITTENGELQYSLSELIDAGWYPEPALIQAQVFLSLLMLSVE